MAKKRRSTAVEEMNGATHAPQIGDPMTYVDNGTKRTVESWESLETKDAKKAFLDKMFHQMDKNFSSNWQQVYAVIDLARSNKWYWQSLGFETFEEFWQDRGKFSFEQFRDLEQAHLFAAMVEPELFNVDAEKAIATAKMLAKVRAAKTKPQSMLKNSNAAKKNKSVTVFDGPTPAEMTEAGEAYAAYGSSGSNGIAYRFARMLRDAPAIAAKVKRGEYIKRQKNGKLKVDLEQAEKDAGLWKPPKKRQSKKRTASERAIDTLNERPIAELRLLKDRMSKKLKRDLLKVLSED